MIGQFAGHSEVLALSPAAAGVSSSQNRTGLDVSKYEGLMAIVLDSSAGGAGATLDVKIQEADTVGGSYTDVPNATFTQVGNAVSRQKLVLNVENVKPAIRVVATIGGTASYNFSVVGLAVPKYG